MKRRLLIYITLVLLFVLPAYAYGDPTGGMLFRMLGPLLAMLWGTWMILANRIRHRISAVIRKWRKVGPNEAESGTGPEG